MPNLKQPSSNTPANGTMDTRNQDQTDYRNRSLCIYHPTNRGTGSALRLEPRISRHDRERYNCFFVEMASQRSVGGRNGDGAHATFDWANKITVKLTFLDMAELLTVMEGRVDSVGNERNGLYHATPAGNTIIAFSRNREKGGYHFSLSHRKREAREPQRIGITLGEAEVTGLRCLLQSSLLFITLPSLLQDCLAASRNAQANRLLATTEGLP